jgi:WD40 repeat protein
MLATTCPQETSGIYLWDALSGRRHRVLRGHVGEEKRVCFHPRQELLLSVSPWGETRYLWHPRTGELLVRSLGGTMFWPQLGASDGVPVEGQMWDVAPGREYRTLMRSPLAGVTQLTNLAIHPGGRLLAVGSTAGVCLWDLSTERGLGVLNPDAAATVLFVGGDLVTQTRAGTQRWPVKIDARSGRCEVGPPRPDRRPIRRLLELDCSRDGKVLAWAARARGTRVVHGDRPDKPFFLPQADVRSIAVSPDGRYIAAGSWWGGGLKVWDAATGQALHDWPDAGAHLTVAYSPEGRYLAASQNTEKKCHVWRVRDWERLYQVDGLYPAFSHDGSVLALETGKGVIRLLRAETGAELARLEDPGEARALRLRFSPDSTLLVVQSCDNQAVHVWDLRKLREGLKLLGLDWDAPPYADPGQAAAAPLDVRIVDPTALNSRAWHLVTGPAGQRDPERALKLIRQALDQEPDNPMYFNTLGVVLYRNRQYKEALAMLEKSLVAGEGEFDAFDLFFLAMCHAKLGDAAKAKDCFDRAVKWVEAQKDLQAQHVEELMAFRAEAEAALRAP